MKSTFMENKEAKHAEWKERRDSAFRTLLEANKDKGEAFLEQMAHDYMLDDLWSDQLHD